MRRSYVWLVMLLVLAMVFTACGNGAEEAVEPEETEEVTEETGAEVDEDENLFRVGMEYAYAPFNWTQLDDSNGAVPIQGTPEFAGGYDVQIAKLIAEGLGRELVIVKMDWNGLPPGVQAGTIDAIIAGMSPTKERAEQIDFTDVYYESDLVMVVLKDGEYADATTLDDFSGAKIAGQLNTFHDTVIDQIPGVDHQVPQESFPALRVALQSGKIDGYVSERPEAVGAIEAMDEFTFVEFEDGFETSPEDTAIAVGLEKDSPLTEDINEILAGISQEERTQIMDDCIANQPLHN